MSMRERRRRSRIRIGSGIDTCGRADGASIASLPDWVISQFLLVTHLVVVLLYHEGHWGIYTCVSDSICILLTSEQLYRYVQFQKASVHPCPHSAMRTIVVEGTG